MKVLHEYRDKFPLKLGVSLTRRLVNARADDLFEEKFSQEKIDKVRSFVQSFRLWPLPVEDQDVDEQPTAKSSAPKYLDPKRPSYAGVVDKLRDALAGVDSGDEFGSEIKLAGSNVTIISEEGEHGGAGKSDKKKRKKGKEEVEEENPDQTPEEIAQDCPCFQCGC